MMRGVAVLAAALRVLVGAVRGAERASCAVCCAPCAVRWAPCAVPRVTRETPDEKISRPHPPYRYLYKLGTLTWYLNKIYHMYKK